ncbi:radical SAM protein [Geoglobus acetivorans]|uniref:Radical SAM protein n=1 Tax=Geoglobus acetivorans TaxID=565033 RepID=A0ABZ3H514_GEOAI|nr:radical SAM protein [Geoglobus acetivorans]
MLDPELKLKLLILGVRSPRGPLRKGGGGPNGGVGFKVEKSVVSAPVRQKYARNSPFKIVQEGGKYILYELENRIGYVEYPEPDYYGTVVGGVPAERYVALDGYDTLVSAISRKCIHWELGKKCSFCNIQKGLKDAIDVKNPELLAQAVKIAHEKDRRRHLTLTTGTVNTTGRGAELLATAVKAIKKEADIPVHVQIEPVDRYWIERLYESGADTIGIHVEVFDKEIRSKVIPGKPSLDRYFDAWKIAVDVFGEWNVSSWLLTGLGERPDSVTRGLETMLSMTVYPFIAPYRPPPGADREPPDLNYHTNLLEKVEETLSDLQIVPAEFKSGCPRCGGCSFIPELL